MKESFLSLNHEQIELINNFIDMIKIVLPSLVTLIATAVGAFAVYKYSLKQVEFKNHKDFIKVQITDFYSPMLGYIKRIRASSSLRVELEKAAGVAWKKQCENNPSGADDLKEAFSRSIKYENEKFPKDLLPLYDSMEKTFTNNYWLANSDTKEYYDIFCRYVELWHRYYDNSIPHEVLFEVPIEEKSLEPFYLNLETTLEQLIVEISFGEKC